MTAVTKFSSGTSLISLPFLDEPGIIGSYLLEGENQLAIIDPGPSSMIEHLLSGIREAGYDPEDVTHILATHVHLDHAGAVGSLVRQMPGARVFVHSKGAPHLLDTSKVVASASRIYKERMQPYWGAIESVPPSACKSSRAAISSRSPVAALRSTTHLGTPSIMSSSSMFTPVNCSLET